MSFGGFERGVGQNQPMAEINVTPLVDVMLVLLVIFIITAPLLARALRVDLPQLDASPAITSPQTIQLVIDASGQAHWNDAPVDADELRARLATSAKQQPQPELHLRADKAARYEHVATALAAAQKAGLTRIGFVTEPAPSQPAAPAP